MDLAHGTCQVDSPLEYVYSSDWVGVVLKDKEACVTRKFSVNVLAETAWALSSLFHFQCRYHTYK